MRKNVVLYIAHGRVAQLGECCIRIAEVEGSTPFASTKNNAHHFGARYFLYMMRRESNPGGSRRKKTVRWTVFSRERWDGYWNAKHFGRRTMLMRILNCISRNLRVHQTCIGRTPTSLAAALPWNVQSDTKAENAVLDLFQGGVLLCLQSACSCYSLSSCKMKVQ